MSKIRAVTENGFMITLIHGMNGTSHASHEKVKLPLVLKFYCFSLILCIVIIPSFLSLFYSFLLLCLHLACNEQNQLTKYEVSQRNVWVLDGANNNMVSGAFGPGFDGADVTVNGGSAVLEVGLLLFFLWR